MSVRHDCEKRRFRATPYWTDDPGCWGPVIYKAARCGWFMNGGPRGDHPIDHCPYCGVKLEAPDRSAEEVRVTRGVLRGWQRQLVWPTGKGWPEVIYVMTSISEYIEALLDD